MASFVHRCAWLCLCLSPLSSAWSSEPSTPATGKHVADDQWRQQGWPLVQSYCIDCHNADSQEAEISFSGFDSVDRMADQQVMWQRALEMVQFGAMPPDDYDQPTDQERAALVEQIEKVLYSAACDLAPKPSKVTVRRLNRAEYNNTIRDLFGLDLRPADAFPSDEVGAGFDNNGDVLSIPPMLLEKYMDAAEEVSQQVILDPSTLEEVNTERGGDALITEGDAWVGSFYGHFLAKDAFVWTEVEVPYEGRYRMEVYAGATKVKAKKRIGVHDADGRLLEVCEFDHYGDGGGSDRQSLDVPMKAGINRFLLVPLEEDQKPEPGDRFDGVDSLTKERIAAGREQVGKSLKVDRGMPEDRLVAMIRRVRVEGPRETPEHLYPSSHKQIITVTPRFKGDDKISVTEAAEKSLRPFLRRAFRGPVDDQTVKAYAGLAKAATDNKESFERGMQVVISAVLVSPRFLFRVELPEGKPQPGETLPLTQHQLASRLSYFLWSSAPDETLLDLADQGKLSEDQVLRDQVRRMLEDPKAEALADNFAAQWLGLRNLDGFEADPKQFPEFDEALRQAMRQETRLLFLDVVRENRSILDLLDSPTSFINQRLAEHYGIPGVEGDEFRRVAVDGVGRGGILTHASVLTLTSNPSRTSPVKRGKWIMENVLGTPPPEPPAGIPALEETATARPGATVREQLEVHRENPSCASCHRVMDDLGFGLENFDVIGQFRQRDGQQPIDASGELPGGRPFDGALPLVRMLRETESGKFARTAAMRLLTFALGRELVPGDRCFVDEIVQQSAQSDHRFVDLATQVVLSKPFRYHTLEGAEP